MIFPVRSSLYFYIRSQSAEIGPPLGTVLGNLGLNASKFVNDFNDFTKELPSYFLLKVFIYILEDRTFSFSIKLPSTGFILMFIKHQKNVIKFSKRIMESYVFLKDVVQLALLKFPNMPLKQTVPIILGTVNSCQLKVILR